MLERTYFIHEKHKHLQYIHSTNLCANEITLILYFFGTQFINVLQYSDTSNYKWHVN